MDPLSDRDRLEAGECRDLVAWQLGMDFAVAVYRLTDGWPRVDPLDLTADMRRNAVDLPGKIAFGLGTGNQELLLGSLRVAKDTACELHAQFGIAERVEYCSKETAFEYRRQISEIIREVEDLENRYPIP